MKSNDEMTFIEAALSGIPVEEILRCSADVQSAIREGSADVVEKSAGELVTRADLEIQTILVDWLKSTSLGESSRMFSEECTEVEACLGRHLYWIVIDPIDGTNEFVRQGERWGCMIGICKRDGQLLYSWNVLSSGEIFSTSTARELQPPRPWRTGTAAPALRLDVFDYGYSTLERFSSAIRDELVRAGVEVRAPELSSSPSAIWAARQLLAKNLDGLVWTASPRGKRTYPCYDLTFLGALTSAGWKSALADRDGKIELVVVAPDDRSLEVLWRAGASLLTGSGLEGSRRVSEPAFSFLGALS